MPRAQPVARVVHQQQLSAPAPRRIRRRPALHKADKAWHRENSHRMLRPRLQHYRKSADPLAAGVCHCDGHGAGRSRDWTLHSIRLLPPADLHAHGFRHGQPKRFPPHTCQARRPRQGQYGRCVGSPIVDPANLLPSTLSFSGGTRACGPCNRKPSRALWPPRCRNAGERPKRKDDRRSRDRQRPGTGPGIEPALRPVDIRRPGPSFTHPRHATP